MMMKNRVFLFIFATAMLLSALALCPTTATAQSKQDAAKDKKDKVYTPENKKFTKENIQSMKIAFFTQELNLTSDEAEKFWPVYNACEKETQEARQETMKNMRELSKASKDESVKNEAVIKLAEKYYNSLDKENKLAQEQFAKYKQVLPIKKAAMVRITDERFFNSLIKQYRHEKR